MMLVRVDTTEVGLELQVTAKIGEVRRAYDTRLNHGGGSLP